MQSSHCAYRVTSRTHDGLIQSGSFKLRDLLLLYLSPLLLSILRTFVPWRPSRALSGLRHRSTPMSKLLLCCLSRMAGHRMKDLFQLQPCPTRIPTMLLRPIPFVRHRTSSQSRLPLALQILLTHFLKYRIPSPTLRPLVSFLSVQQPSLSTRPPRPRPLRLTLRLNLPQQPILSIGRRV